MVTEHKLLKGTPEEIAEYITSLPNYTSGLGNKLDIKKQLDNIGLEKLGMVFYLGTEMSLVSLYVHPIDVTKRGSIAYIEKLTNE